MQRGTDIDGEEAGDRSGHSVSMSSDGNTLAIGAPSNDGTLSLAGHVRIYQWSGAAWTQKGADIDGEAVNDWSGESVSMSSDGNSLAIGAANNDGTGTDAGHVRIYWWSGSAWAQKGADIDGEAADDWSGESVSMSSDGNTLAIGAPLNDGTGVVAGHVRIYEWNGSAWTQKGADIDGEAANNFSGFSVSMSSDGNTVAIGAYGNGGTASLAGHVRIYEWSGSAWTQKGADIDGEDLVDESGYSVSMSSDGNTLAIGARWNDGTGIIDAGHVRIYEWSGSAWTQKGADIDGEATNDESGYSVSMSSDGNTLAIGAPYNDETGTSAGHVRVYHFCTSITPSSFSISSCASYTVPSGDETYTTVGNYTVLDTITNTEGCDSVMTIDLTINATLSGTDIQASCGAYTWLDGNTYTTSNNTATVILTTAAGCDSVVTLDLTINTVDSSVTQSGITLTADETGATYQWLDCSAMTSISGAIDQSYTPTANGDYAVIVSNNGCTDTSACYTVTVVGIIENDLGNELLLYPNPTEGHFSIDLGDNYEYLTVTMTDINGSVLKSNDFRKSQLLNLQLEEPAGVYLLIIESGSGKAVVRLVKE